VSLLNKTTKPSLRITVYTTQKLKSGRISGYLFKLVNIIQNNGSHENWCFNKRWMSKDWHEYGGQIRATAKRMEKTGTT